MSTPHEQRDATGRFLPGHTQSLQHGARAEQVREGRLLTDEAAAAVAELRTAILADLGGADRLSVLERQLVERYVEHKLIADHIFGFLAREGTVTTKGRTRMALQHYLKVSAAERRLAEQLGLARRQKPVASLQELIA